MDVGQRRAHWDEVYRTRTAGQVSWFQAEPEMSLALLERAGLADDSCVIDVGGGDSRLVDRLLARGLRCLTVLDISASALDRARRRLGASADHVRWLAVDVTGDWSVPLQDVWHDRAVFHFLVDPDDRARYVARLRATVKPGGVTVVATFGPAGPPYCSGLPVRRYSPLALAEELGQEFRLREHATEDHRTPAGIIQPFVYGVFERR